MAEWVKVKTELPERTVKSILGEQTLPAETVESWHTQGCVDALARYQEELSAFEGKYPHYCRSCGGTGVIEYTENQSPLGSGHYWPMTMTDACGSCLELGICPLCGGEFPEEEEDTNPMTVAGIGRARIANMPHTHSNATVGRDLTIPIIGGISGETRRRNKMQWESPYTEGYKVVRPTTLPGEVYCSAWAKSMAVVLYEPMKWATAPEFLAVRGYYPTAFPDLVHARNFARGIPWAQVWRADLDNIQCHLPQAFDVDIFLLATHAAVIREMDEAKWPGAWARGTVMAGRVRLRERLT